VTSDQDDPAANPATPLPPAGWYPDPSGQSQLRWWDGRMWSVHMSGAPVRSAPYGSEVQIGGHRVELAGWGRRAGGYLIDNLILLFPILILNIVVGLSLKSNTSNYQLLGTGNHVSLTVVVILDIVGAAIHIGYSVWMLRWRGQTVGMIAVDAVMVDHQGAAKLNWSQIWKRVLFVQILSTLPATVFSADRHPTAVVTYPNTVHVSAVLVISLLIFGATTLLLYLWPLGSRLNQTLQDKFAGTLVIRTH
jgi:uncharacterized RDD family membrane protein YckC